MPRMKRVKTKKKREMRKLSSRELVGIVLLATLALGYVYIKYLILPQRDNLNKVQSQMATIQAEVDRVRGYRALNDKLEEQLIEEGMKLDDAFSRHFTKLNQEDLIMLISEKIDSTGIESEGLNFDRPTVDEVASEELERSSLEISFKSGYQMLSGFLEAIEEYEKRIIVNKISLNREEDGVLSGTLLIDLYSIESIVEDAMTLFPWDQDAEKIAANPFSPFSSYIQEEIIGDNDISSDDTDRGDNPGSGMTSSDGNSSGTNIPGSNMGNGSTSGSTSGITGPGTGVIGSGSGTSGQTKPPVDDSEEVPDQGEDTPPAIEEKGELVEAFENSSEFFAVGNPRDDVLVSVEGLSDSTGGKSSLNLKYNFLKERGISTASIGFKNELTIVEASKRFRLDVKPIAQNEHKLGVVVRDSKGRLADITISENLNWSGWKSLEADIPEDLVYPVKVQRFYVESWNFNKVLLGDLLIDSFKTLR